MEADSCFDGSVFCSFPPRRELTQCLLWCMLVYKERLYELREAVKKGRRVEGEEQEKGEAQHAFLLFLSSFSDDSDGIQEALLDVYATSFLLHLSGIDAW